MIKKFSFFYHPTGVIFVDDQELFIHSTLAMLPDLTHCQAFLYPKEALKHLNKLSDGVPFTENFKHLDNKSETILTKKELATYLNSLDRFNATTTLIIDYAMPDLNGLEVCKAIADKLFKKIMLTGEATPELAVNALNNRLIDKFIYKNTPNVFQELNQAIDELRMESFEELTSRTLTTRLPKFLYTAAFQEFFMTMLKKYKGIEYYLINTLGDFLIIDAEGHTTWLSIRDEAGQEFTRKLLEAQYQKKANEDLDFALEHLKQKNQYLFVYGFGLPDKNYKDLVLPANPIKFDQHACYYAALPVKLDLKIKPLSTQKPQYTLNKDKV